MSSALDKMVPVFTGSNWQQWHTTMQAYLRAQGQWFIYGTACPDEEHDTWDEHNEKVLGKITLCVSPSIQVAISHLTMVKEVWEHLKENYGTPSIGSAYAELSCLLSTTIPTGSHPTPAITKMLSHFAYLKDTGFEFPANMQAMIILCKLPPTMEVVAQILSQTSPSEIKTLKPDGIVKAAMSCTKYVWYHGHRDHVSCIPKTEELFQEHFYWLKAPGVEEEEDCRYHPMHRLL